MSDNFDDFKDAEAYNSLIGLTKRKSRSLAKEAIAGFKAALKSENAYIKKKTFFSRRTHNVLERVLEDHIKGIPTPLPLLRSHYKEKYEDNSDFTYYDVMSNTLSKNDPFFIQQGRLSGFNPNKYHLRESPLALKIRRGDYNSVLQLIYAGVDVNEDINIHAETQIGSHESSKVRSSSALRYAFELGLGKKPMNLDIARALALSGARDTPDNEMTTCKEMLMNECINQLTKTEKYFQSLNSKNPLKLTSDDIDQMDELFMTLEVFKKMKLIDPASPEDSDSFKKITTAMEVQHHKLLESVYLSSKNRIAEEFQSLTKKEISQQQYLDLLLYFEKKRVQKNIKENELYDRIFDDIHNNMSPEEQKRQNDGLELLNAIPFLTTSSLDALKNEPNYSGVAYKPIKGPLTFESDGAQLDRYAFRIEALDMEMKHLMQSYYILTDGFKDTRKFENERREILEQLEKFPEMINLIPGELDNNFTKNKKVQQKWNEGHNNVVGLKRNETFGMMIMRSGDTQMIEKIIRNAGNGVTDLNILNTRGDSYLSILLEEENWNAIEYLLEQKDAKGNPAFDVSIPMPPLAEGVPPKTFAETLALKYSQALRENPKKAEVYKKAIFKFNKYMHPSFQVTINELTGQASSLNSFGDNHDVAIALEDMQYRNNTEQKLLENKNKPLDSFDIIDVKSTSEALVQPHMKSVMESLLAAHSEGTIEAEKDIRQFINSIFKSTNLESGVHYSTRLIYELINANTEIDAEGKPTYSSSNTKHKEAVAVALKVFMGTKEFSVSQLQESVNFNNITSLTYSECLRHLGYSIMDIGYDIPGYSKEQLTELSKALVEQNDTLSAVRSKLADEYIKKMDQDKGLSNE